MRHPFRRLATAVLLLMVPVFGVGISAAYAQDYPRPASQTHSVQPLASVPRMEVPAIDAAALLRRDEAQGDLERWGEPVAVDLTPQNSGQWETLADGSPLWRLRVGAPGAKMLVLIFERYHMPEGGTLHVLTPAGDSPFRRRPYATVHNKLGRLAAGPLPGDEAVIEVSLPAGQAGALDLKLGTVTRGYKSLGPAGGSSGLTGTGEGSQGGILPQVGGSTSATGCGAFGLEPCTGTDELPPPGTPECNNDPACAGTGGGSGYCQVNWVCPEPSPISGFNADVGRGAVQIINGFGSFICSGSLVNNTAGDFRQYAYTALHCGFDPTDFILVFNFHSATCARGGPFTLADSVSGLERIALNLFTDVALHHILEPIPPEFGPYFIGVQPHLNFATTTATVLHHPNGAPLKTSWWAGTPQPGNFGAFAFTHWVVGPWTQGTTEPGSSGSPLLDDSGRIVGHLHGGFSLCNNTSPTDTTNNGGLDFFGRLGIAWFFGTSGRFFSTRLCDHLDPFHTLGPVCSLPERIGPSGIAGADPPGSLVVKVISKLKAILGADSDQGTKAGERKEAAKELKEAIADLTHSLTPKRWVGPAHLALDGGEEVFHRHQAAIDELLEIGGDEDDEAAAARAAINTIVAADRLFVPVLLANGKMGGGDAALMKKAEALLAEGDEAAAAGEYRDAVENYKRAWHRAARGCPGWSEDPPLDANKQPVANFCQQ